MSWLSNFLGLKRVKMPAVQQAQELDLPGDFDEEQYLKYLMKKSGFEKTIVTGHKLPALAPKSYLGAI